MMNFTELASASSDPPAPFIDQLRLAVAAYLARFKGSSREHTESDLRCYLAWCAERGLDPLAAQRPHTEPYTRWMQEIRRVQALHRLPAVLGRGRVLPDLRPGRRAAAFTRRACAPSRRPGRVTHLGVHPLAARGLLTAARESANPCDFALVAMLGLLGLRIFEATTADIGDLGEEHSHRVLRVCGKGTKIVPSS
jgi:integrase/recombinase XerD